MAESAAFDNPLIPNARLREMYRAMLMVRALEQSLVVKQRSGILGLEACLVASSIGLIRGDLISDMGAGTAMRFLRGLALHRALNPNVKSRRRGVFAECGGGTTLPIVPLTPERLWAAIGAAASLQARHRLGDAERNVAVVYLRDHELSGPIVRRILQYAGDQLLPLLFITVPVNARPAPGKGSELARRSGVPAISVDVEDGVAIYRVVQESLGRARAGGGPALIHCVPFVLPGTARTPVRQTNGALAAIERYILERHIVTHEWLAGERRNLARHLGQPVH